MKNLVFSSHLCSYTPTLFYFIDYYIIKREKAVGMRGFM